MAFKDAERRNAYMRNYLSQPEVKAKRRETYKRWAAENRDHILAKEAKRRLEKRGQCMVATVRTRARLKGYEFDLDQHVADVQARLDVGVCELTGQPFDFSPGRKFNSPSIDRKDPNRGYTYDNIRIVLNVINVAMGDWGEEVLAQVVQQWIIRRNAVNAEQARAWIETVMECLPC